MERHEGALARIRRLLATIYSSLPPPRPHIWLRRRRRPRSYIPVHAQGRPWVLSRIRRRHLPGATGAMDGAQRRAMPVMLLDSQGITYADDADIKPEKNNNTLLGQEVGPSHN